MAVQRRLGVQIRQFILSGNPKAQESVDARANTIREML